MIKTSKNSAFFRGNVIKSACTTIFKIEITNIIGCQLMLIVYLVTCYNSSCFPDFQIQFSSTRSNTLLEICTPSVCHMKSAHQDIDDISRMSEV